MCIIFVPPTQVIQRVPGYYIITTLCITRRSLGINILLAQEGIRICASKIWYIQGWTNLPEAIPTRTLWGLLSAYWVLLSATESCWVRVGIASGRFVHPWKVFGYVRAKYGIYSIAIHKRFGELVITTYVYFHIITFIYIYIYIERERDMRHSLVTHTGIRILQEGILFRAELCIT